MALSVRTKNELQRWYALKEHPVQLALVHDNIRFKCAPAGRRSGKTERAKRYMAKTCMSNANENYFIAAPTRDQVKKMYWEDMKKLCLTSLCHKTPSETELTIFFNNGTKLILIGLDKPSRIEGIYWTGGIIDEIADVKPEAWEANIRPALDTFNPTRPDYKPWCWLIGVPDGLNHYYDLCEYAKTANDPEWGLYTWPSSDILPPETIEAAKRQMSTKQFRQEYEACFENATGRIYEDYGPANYTNETIQPHEIIHYYCDFNFTPMSHGIAVIRGDDVYLLDEIILESAIAEQNAIEFVEKYKDHKNKTMHLYGDPSGKNGEKHGHESDYINMERVFRNAGWKVTRKVKRAHPAIKDRQNAVRAKIKSADGHVSLYCNPNTAPWNHKALSTIQTKEGSTFLEDEKNKYQHISTAFGYMIDYLWPVKIKLTSIPMNIFGRQSGAWQNAR